MFLLFILLLPFSARAQQPPCDVPCELAQGARAGICDGKLLTSYGVCGLPQLNASVANEMAQIVAEMKTFYSVTLAPSCQATLTAFLCNINARHCLNGGESANEMVCFDACADVRASFRLTEQCAYKNFEEPSCAARGLPHAVDKQSCLASLEESRTGGRGAATGEHSSAATVDETDALIIALLVVAIICVCTCGALLLVYYVLVLAPRAAGADDDSSGGTASIGRHSADFNPLMARGGGSGVFKAGGGGLSRQSSNRRVSRASSRRGGQLRSRTHTLSEPVVQSYGPVPTSAAVAAAERPTYDRVVDSAAARASGVGGSVSAKAAVRASVAGVGLTCPVPGCRLLVRVAAELVEHCVAQHPFRCVECEARYSLPGELIRHFTMRHNKKGPTPLAFQCPYCADFSCKGTPHAMLDHVEQLHAGMFACQECASKYDTAADLTLHVSKRHARKR